VTLESRAGNASQDKGKLPGRLEGDETCGEDARLDGWHRWLGRTQGRWGGGSEQTGGHGRNKLAKLVTRWEFAFTLLHKEGRREERTTRMQLLGTTVAIQGKLLLVGSRCSYNSSCEVSCHPR